MGFFKWLDQKLRDSNENFYERLDDSYQYRQEQIRQDLARMEKMKEIDCCANCCYYNGRCDKGIVEFTYGQMQTKVPYERVCEEFSR